MSSLISITMYKVSHCIFLTSNLNSAMYLHEVCLYDALSFSTSIMSLIEANGLRTLNCECNLESSFFYIPH